jgi:SanA protein
MLKKIIKFVFRMLKDLPIVGALILILPRLITSLYVWKRTYEVPATPARKVAIIFGAGLTRSGEATPILKDRVETAAKLYFARKVEKLLMSGDNRFVSYNEPEAMRQYALALGVPDIDIVLDFAGRRTYDTCYRAKAIFGVTEAILVTQKFHLSRAIFLCNMLGVGGTGVVSSRQFHLFETLFALLEPA